jgi:hypothetical protein
VGQCEDVLTIYCSLQVSGEGSVSINAYSKDTLFKVSGLPVQPV